MVHLNGSNKVVTLAFNGLNSRDNFPIAENFKEFVLNLKAWNETQVRQTPFNIITPFPSLWPLETSDLWCFKGLDKENMGLAWVKRLHSQSGWDFYEPFKTIFSLIWTWVSRLLCKSRLLLGGTLALTLSWIKLKNS